MFFVNVCFCLFRLSDAKVFYKDNTHASLETKELLTLSECLPTPNGDVKDTCRKAYARKDAKTHMILETKTHMLCPLTV